MKFARLGPKGAERPCILMPNGSAKDASSLVHDLDPDGIAVLHQSAAALDTAALPDVATSSRVGAPVARPGKIVGIGLNYRDHAIEAKLDIPSEPVVFLKSPTTLAGPDDDLAITPDMEALDWEIELALVIGAHLRHASMNEAEAGIFGYTIANDLSERRWQFERGGSWDKGKSYDGFCPLGPVVATGADIGDPNNLDLILSLNGEHRQASNTSEMIFSPVFLVSYVSQFMSLSPGDIIITGTPAGVGMGQCPAPVFLAPGDRVVGEISGIGRQSFSITLAE